MGVPLVTRGRSILKLIFSKSERILLLLDKFTLSANVSQPTHLVDI